jgi:hypothetical protein
LDKAGKRDSGEAGKVGGAARQRAQLSLCLLFTVSVSSLDAQVASEPEWIVGGGGGAVIRTVHTGSLGVNLQAARVVQPARAVYLEPGVIWQWYARSPDHGDLCPPEGCPPPLENAISIVGPELRAAYREPESNPVYPVVGLGLYWVSSQDTSGVRFGVNAGLAISLRRSGSGPSLDFRYFHVFGDTRFKSAFPLALRWSF